MACFAQHQIIAVTTVQAKTYPIQFGNKTWFPAPPPEVDSTQHVSACSCQCTSAAACQLLVPSTIACSCPGPSVGQNEQIMRFLQVTAPYNVSSPSGKESGKTANATRTAPSASPPYNMQQQQTQASPPMSPATPAKSPSPQAAAPAKAPAKSTTTTDMGESLCRVHGRKACSAMSGCMH